jgi:hypothetical protein
VSSPEIAHPIYYSNTYKWHNRPARLAKIETTTKKASGPAPGALLLGGDKSPVFKILTHKPNEWKILACANLVNS